MLNTSPSALHIARLDTLRAIAVSVVVIFHLLPEALPWGYIGVDMFFSLSGFLMTLLYLKARARDRDFPAIRFVARRFWRIFPPLALTSALTLIVAYMLLSPEHLVDTAYSAIAALASFSNWVFFAQSGYFDTNAILKPLLHTWSLGVEEQFYAIFALALLIVRFVPLIISLCIVTALSFGAWLWVVSANAGAPLHSLHDEPFNALFFLPQYRAFQFTLGGLSAYVLMYITVPSRLFGWAGSAILLLGVWLAADKATAHISALAIALGMSGVMIRAHLLDICARTALVRYLARISYQLYLVHWPVIVFWHYVTLAPLSWGVLQLAR